MFTLVLLLAVSICFASNDAKVKCSKNECLVQFQLESGKIQAFKMIKERKSSSLFSEDAKVFWDEETHSIQQKRNLKNGQRWVNLKGAALATAVLSENSELISGIFSTEEGVVEFRKSESGPARQTIRRLNEEGQSDIVLVPPPGQPWDEFSSSRLIDDSAMMNAKGPNGESLFYPGCFENDAVPHSLQISLIFDLGTTQQLTSQYSGTSAQRLSQVLDDLDHQFSFGKQVYSDQLNVRVKVASVRFSKASDPVPFQRTSGQCEGALKTHDDLVKWAGDYNDQFTGYTMLISNCFSGVVGVSYIGSLCTKTSVGVSIYSWLTLFHELGHAIGGSHTFGLGGIMDYGDGKYDGTYQFHPNNRNQICGFLSIIKGMSERGSCPWFQKDSIESQCGNGFIDEDEDCECLDGSTKCGLCQDCQLNDDLSCSSSDFVLRKDHMKGSEVVTAELLDHPECCLKGNLAPPKTLCASNPGEKKLNVCSAGACMPVCTKFLFPDSENCGFDNSGCKLGCFWKGYCSFKLGYVNDAPDGTVCNLQNGQKGSCKTGVCSSDGSTPPPSIFDDDTATLTYAPVSKQTSTPTSEAPSTSPVPPPTSKPALGPLIDNLACQKRKRVTNCRRLAGCSWCGAALKCVSTETCNSINRKRV